MIEVVRREIGRALAGVRQGLRAVQTGLGLATRVQRINGIGLSAEELADMELFQHFGFTSAPPDGAQLIVLPIGGRTSAAVVIATEHGAYRFKLDFKGEAALYNQWGDVIHIRKDRTIHIKAAAKLEIEAPLATFSGNVEVAGTLTAAVDVVADGVHLKTHQHSGVEAGGANTGGPV
jgi:phage gp45-like